MGNVSKITKTQFNAAYDKYPPSKWISFGYKYFSKDTEKKDIKLKNVVTYVLLTLFLIGFVGSIFNFSGKIMGIVTISYTAILFLLASYIFSVHKLNKKRLKKIMELLDITEKEYNYLIYKFKY